MAMWYLIESTIVALMWLEKVEGEVEVRGTKRHNSFATSPMGCGIAIVSSP